MTLRAQLRLVAGVALAPCLFLFFTLPDPRVKASILISAAVSAAGFAVTKRAIPLLKGPLVRAGLSGLDINKKGTAAGEKRVPESMGLASGVVFLICIVLFQQLHYHDVASVLHLTANGGGWRALLAVERQVASDA
eukprot:scaffold7.g3762.t1